MQLERLVVLFITAILVFTVQITSPLAVRAAALTVNPATDIVEWKRGTDKGDSSGTTWNVCEGPNGQKALQINYFFRNTDPKADGARDWFYLAGPIALDVSPYSWMSVWVKGSGMKKSGSGQYFLFVQFIDGSGKTWKMGAFSVADTKWRKYECSLDAPAGIDPVVCEGAADLDFNRKDVKSIKIYLHEAGAGGETVGSGSIAVGPITLSNDDRVRLLDDNLACLSECSGALGLPSKPAVARLSSQWKSGLDLGTAEGRARSLKNKVLREAASALTGLPQKSVRYCVGTEKPINKLTPDPYRFTGSVSGSIRLSAAGHEYESGKLVFLPLGQKVKGIRVSVAGDLVSGKGDRIPSSAVEVRLGSFVNCTPTAWVYYDYVGEIEDPLLKNAPFDLAPGRVQPVWVTVHVPAGTPKERYAGQVRISAEDAHPWKINLEVDVKGFDLPVESHVVRHFYYWGGNTARWYGYPIPPKQWGSEIPEEILRRHLALLLSYRINPGNIFSNCINADFKAKKLMWPLKARDGKIDFTKFDEMLTFCEKRGLSGLILGDFSRWALSTNKSWLWLTERGYPGQLVAHLKKIGWFERSCVKLVDEPGAQFHWMVEDQAKTIHAVDPDLKTLVAGPSVRPGLGKYVDIALPPTPFLTPEDAAMLRGEGVEVGWYVCCIPFHHPEVNYFINYPGLDPRILEWMNWKFGIKQTLYWGVNVWHGQREVDSNVKPPGEPRWPDIPWNPHSYADYNGDGNLTYPWPDGDLLASVRLELIRDGAEDYEYFYILDDLAKQIRAKGLSGRFVKKAQTALRLDPIVTDPRNYETDPMKLMAYRDHVGSLIEQGRKILRK